MCRQVALYITDALIVGWEKILQDTIHHFIFTMQAHRINILYYLTHTHWTILRSSVSSIVTHSKNVFLGTLNVVFAHFCLFSIYVNNECPFISLVGTNYAK